MVRQAISKISVSREVSVFERQLLIATLFWFGIAGGLAVRILPWLRGLLPFNPGDPARYYMATLNVFDSGSIEATPFYESVYNQVSMLLNWPGFHILQSVVAQFSNIDLHTNLTLFFVGNGLIGGTLLAAAGYLLGESLFSRRIGYVSAVAVLYVDQGIYYQSEYHAQGLGLSLVVFAVATYIKSYRSHSSSMGYRVIAIIAFAAATISHHFSSYMLIPFSVAFLCALVLPRFYKQYKGTHALIVFVLIAAYSTYFANDFIMIVASKLDNFSPSNLGTIVQADETRPIQAQLKFFSRLPFGMLLLFSLLPIIKARNVPVFRLVLLIFVTLLAAAGIFMSFALGAPLNRVFVFIEILLVPFIVHGAFVAADHIKLQYTFPFTLLTFVLILNLASVFPAQYWGFEGQQNSYYWYSGRAIPWEHANNVTSFITNSSTTLNGEIAAREADPFYNALFIELKPKHKQLVRSNSKRSILDAMQRSNAQLAILDIQDDEYEEENLKASNIWSVVYTDGLAGLLSNPKILPPEGQSASTKSNH